jgi:NADPH:quinone reductase-like Zn-dependent oxidoreductase
MTAFQMPTRCQRLQPGATILVFGASGTVGTALLDLARTARSWFSGLRPFSR